MSGAATAPEGRGDVGKAQLIETERLRLVPLGLADATAIVHGHRPAGARWADGYPTDRTLVVAGSVVTAEGRPEGGLGPYRSYQIVRREDGVVIGDCGFLGPPDEHGDVHVGFGIADVVQGHRYAGEAVRALIAWARTQPEVARVVADVALTNIASRRVLEGAGMRRTGTAAGLVFYEA